METLLQLPSEISKISSMANRSLRLQVDTQENLTDEAMAKIMGQLNKLGYFCFLAGEKKIEAWDVAGLPNINYPKDEKSPSQRLQAVIYRYWEQNGSTGEFRLYYERAMDKLIDSYKERLT